MSPSLLRDNDESEFQLSSEGCFWTTRVFTFIFDATIFGLLIAIVSHAGSNTYGEFVLNPVNSYSWAAFIAFFIYEFLLIFDTCVAFRMPLLLVFAMFHGLIIYFLLGVIKYSSTGYGEKIIQVSYQNWRIDIEYLKFETDNSCYGIKAAKDNCTRCCDNYFESALYDKLSSVRTLSIITFCFCIANFLQTTLPSLCCQLICG